MQPTRIAAFLDELEKISLSKEAFLGEMFNPAYRKQMYDLGHRGVEAMGAHAANDAVLHGISKLPTRAGNVLMHSPGQVRDLAGAGMAFGPLRGTAYLAGLKATKAGVAKGSQIARKRAPRLAKMLGALSTPVAAQEAAWSHLPAQWEGGIQMPGLLG